MPSKNRFKCPILVSMVLLTILVLVMSIDALSGITRRRLL